MSDEKMKDSEIEIGEMKNSQHKIELCAVSNGEVLSIENVPDKVFAQRMIGDGFAVKPTSQSVVAPVSGKLIEVADAKHAYYIETEEGVKILIHVGINTLLLNGEGFSTKLEKGDKVEKGKTLVDFDEELIIKKGYNPIISVIVLDNEDVQMNQEVFPAKGVIAGETIAMEINF
ncbi:PTS glucose transporter subunit IIA [Marinilactibacillus psychrotolerans]|uniref:PTS glucose transporter subunit IIA n=2 Tax=Marinilactibacillus psychrotolerans TaxID=191770 RepID=A0A511H161_9LACT|nr:glucose PTS transporter subunit IIA [Marinilactibacillus psychrotolerans]TLQ07308.1 PTS glucose transporter subunit IIA [Marinilactibacillus psychrotolerans]SDC51986.1 PTS system, glucose-specific IIA component [Marinilactibacillus psychrotolerans]SJN32238.1 PTS system, glucose-specific IIC component / PTS system, glucose-specific IIB component / PTS system, glucose-specific IIA component [Marinilactibacillus psychrotolerans 42ea]GEL66509.1 hypothetical protein MPS01_06640 [Marinilactibacill